MSLALDARENVVGVVRLLRRGAGGGDARDEPVYCDKTGALSRRKASKSKSNRGSRLTRAFSRDEAKGFTGGGRRDGGVSPGRFMGMFMGCGGGRALPSNSSSDVLIRGGGGGGSGGCRPMLPRYGQVRGIASGSNALRHGLGGDRGLKGEVPGGGGGGSGPVKGFGRRCCGLAVPSLSCQTRRGGGEGERSRGRACSRS